MTDRVSGNGVTISAVKSIEYLPENTLPYRLHPNGTDVQIILVLSISYLIS